MSGPEKWNQVAMVFELTAQALKARWGCEVAPQDALPNESLERLVDHWCLRLADNLMLPIDPPDPVRPWLLARLSCVAVSLRTRAAEQGPFPGLSKDEICDLLTKQWHTKFRDLWALLVLEDFEAVARMALAPGEPIPLRGSQADWPRYLLRERLRLAADLAEALCTPCPEAERPCALFPRAMHEGAPEQLVLWALRGYWREKGCQRWLLHQLHCLLYAARVNGWKQV